ncbi:MAG: hypothetical protein QM750_28445 [Rubrivivax sp.]
MQKKRFHPLAIAFALALWSAGAGALGFGAAGSAATLGQSLDHAIALRLDPGETLAPECVGAEVTVGEQRLPAAAVRTRLESDGATLLLRVQTHSIIDEPVLTVAVSLGCPVRLSRRFTLFADPAPLNAAPPVLAAAVEPVPAAALAQTPAPAAAEARPAPARPRSEAAGTRSTAAPTVRRPRPAPRRTATAAAPAPAAERPARPRLKLDAVEPPPAVSAPAPITAEAVEAAASAAAAQAAALAASAAAARIAALEQVIEKMRAESAADRETLRLLREKVAETDAVSAWTPWLAALSAALAALALWLALKLRRLQRERQQAWWQAGAAGKSTGAGAAAAAAAAGEARGDTAGGAEPSGPGAAPTTSSGGYNSTRPGTLGPVFAAELPSVSALSEPPTSPMEQTQALPVGWREDQPARDVSIEELIDLEQQAEFFVVLGQDEAAIDLLVDHLRSTGGGSPLPYLKLLEIYRRRGDREAYERTRARFNHRFNAYAPDWETDPAEGRSLEDYPAVVARLQMVWPSPIDAMAALESLLFRKSRGELFDMPAYRDVLFLYSLARDLLDREPLESGRVDVLLPIGDGADFTQPMSLEELPPAFDSGLVPLDNAPTVPVDLDVTQPQVPESLFGETATEPGVPGSGGGRRRR